jgi:hypothetical protein
MWPNRERIRECVNVAAIRRNPINTIMKRRKCYHYGTQMGCQGLADQCIMFPIA